MDESTLLSLMVDLHRDGERQGPGGTEQRYLALKLSGIFATYKAKAQPGALLPGVHAQKQTWQVARTDYEPGR